MLAEYPLSLRQTLEIADQFAQASAHILDLRVEKRASLTDREARILEQCEDRIDKIVAIFRSSGIAFLEARVDALTARILAAIQAAKRALHKVMNFEQAVATAEAIAHLAAAVLTKVGTQVNASVDALLVVVADKGAALKV